MWIFFGVIFFFFVYFMSATQLTKRWLVDRKKAILDRQKERKNDGN